MAERLCATTQEANLVVKRRVNGAVPEETSSFVLSSLEHAKRGENTAV
jgi:hypothetical protein